jgi:AbrB family looped-hinge helix DNA binding protein
MLTRLSSKGQLVIPSPVRKALGLRAGTQFHLRLEEGRIILEPIGTSPIEALYGKYSDSDLLADLEAEHEQELMREAEIRA